MKRKKRAAPHLLVQLNGEQLLIRIDLITDSQEKLEDFAGIDLRVGVVNLTPKQVSALGETLELRMSYHGITVAPKFPDLDLDFDSVIPPYVPGEGLLDPEYN